MENPRNMIGPQLRQIRNNRGLSQPKLAELLQRKGWDISRDTVAKIEDQRRWVSDFETAFLAEVLQVPLEVLFVAPGRSPKARDYISRLERPLG
ncbi:MAG TPA: helix-turn-helix transcriptional regulator [Chthoniobacterales bacterium]|nr:helix-turn-helix transcriptional regulator [Chthoniobacterales bacterium]